MLAPGLALASQLSLWPSPTEELEPSLTAVGAGVQCGWRCPPSRTPRGAEGAPFTVCSSGSVAAGSGLPTGNQRLGTLQGPAGLDRRPQKGAAGAARALSPPS